MIIVDTLLSKGVTMLKQIKERLITIAYLIASPITIFCLMWMDLGNFTVAAIWFSKTFGALVLLFGGVFAFLKGLKRLVS